MYSFYSHSPYPPHRWNSPPFPNDSSNNSNHLLNAPLPHPAPSTPSEWNNSFNPLFMEAPYNWNVNKMWRPPPISLQRNMNRGILPQQQSHLSQTSSQQHTQQLPVPQSSHQLTHQPSIPQTAPQQPFLKQMHRTGLSRSQHAPWTGIPWSTKMHLRHTHTVTVVLKLSPLDFSYGSPIFQEFIYHVLPHWKAYVPDSQNYSQHPTFSTEVILHQSNLTSQSLAYLLDALVQHNLIPSTIHLGSNPNLQESGINVLANYIRNSFSPLRWISLSKCNLPAIVKTANLYPRTTSTHPVPIWIDLGTMDATELFDELDKIDSNLYCPAFDRTACGINRCKQLGVVMHLAVIPPAAVGMGTEQQDTENLIDENPSALSEISSEDDEEEIFIDRLYEQPSLSKQLPLENKNKAPIENLYKVEDSILDDESEEQQYLKDVYSLFLKKAFIDLSFYATRRRILPTEIIRHMYIKFVEKEPVYDIPSLWLLHSFDDLTDIFIEQEKLAEEDQKAVKPKETSTGEEPVSRIPVDRVRDKTTLENFPMLESLIRSYDDELDEVMPTELNYAQQMLAQQEKTQQNLLSQTSQQTAAAPNSQFIDISDSAPPLNNIPYESQPASTYYTKTIPKARPLTRSTPFVLPDTSSSLITETQSIVLDCASNDAAPEAANVLDSNINQSTEKISSPEAEEVEEGEITDSPGESPQRITKKRKTN